ncbi:MAG: MBL fold metallo-hydrolase [Candidatus Hydrogenedentes bacterium]|nr:MBL fold metallo-hydrolase [Candidatus Hydrogenedentota bacterium]
MSTITFKAIGGGAEIGANSYVISAGGHDVLLDCGLHPKKEGLDALPEFGLLERAPEAILVSHGHIDHCGAVPYVMRDFPATPCYTTHPTVSIMDRMLHNSVSVMGTLGTERGIREYPLYTHSDVDSALRRCHGLHYEREFDLTWDSPFRASFHHSGHVLGSASVLLRNEGHTLLYSGDVCMTHQELMAGMTLLDKKIAVDSLMIECTRATHEIGHTITFEGEVERFAENATAVLTLGGSVLVPSFALGRTQEMLNVISRLQGQGRIPDVPVYSSGLGRAMYEIYSKFSDLLRPESVLRPLQEFNRIGDVWDGGVRRELLRRPCIIVATSGMMVENTPSALIAMEMVRDPRHAIFFVGYLDPDTLGAKLMRADLGDALSFERDGPPVTIKTMNRKSFNFSAHAHREDLVRLIDHIAPKNLIFVHGDPDATAWMKENTSSVYRKFIPSIGETLPLES